MNSLIQFFVYSNLFVSICATAMTHLTYIILSLPKNDSLPVLLFVFCSTFFTYNFQRIIKLRNHQLDEKNIGTRLKWIIKNKNTLLFSSILIGTVGLVTSFFIHPYSITLLVPLSFLSIFYVLPIVPSNKKWVDLRSIPFIKIIIISIVWVLTTVGLPHINEFGFSITNKSLLLFTLFKQFLFIFAITLPFDIRDLEFDFQSNLKTIPTIIGIKKSIALSEILLFVFILISYIQYYCFNQLPLSHLLSLTFSITIAATLIAFSSKKRGELFYSGLLEGTMLIMYLGVVIAEYL